MQHFCFYPGLGARLVLIVGAKTQTDAILRANNRQPQYVGGYRVTDEASMQAATQAAGSARVEIEAQLSRVLPRMRGDSASVDTGACALAD